MFFLEENIYLNMMCQMLISQFMMYLLESKEATLKWIHTIIDCQ